MGCAAVMLTTLLMIFTGRTVCAKKIVTEKVICQSDGPLILTCPENHKVVIRKAKYFRSRQPGCVTTDVDSCFIEKGTLDMFKRCYKAQPCHIEVRTITSGNCSSDYTGEVYLKLLYQCEPWISLGDDTPAKILNMCSSSTWSGSLAYIYSPGFPMWTDVPHCACSIRLHQQVELQIKVPYFKPSLTSQIAVPSKDYCAQSLTFWNTTVLNRICASHKDTLELVRVLDSMQVHVQYESIPTLQSSFIISVQVHHAERMTINCTSDYQQPPPSSLTTRPTLPNIPTSRMTRPTTKRPTRAPTVAVMKTTRKLHVAATTKPYQRSSATRPPLTSTMSVGGKTTDSDDATSRMPTTRTQPLLVDKVQWPLITGVVAAAMVIIILITALLLFCRRTGQKKANAAYGQREIADFTFENVVYMTSTEVAALQIGQDNAAATGGASTSSVTVVVDNHGDTSVVAGKEQSCDVTPCTSCDPTPYTSMTDLTVKDQATLMENQLESL